MVPMDRHRPRALVAAEPPSNTCGAEAEARAAQAAATLALAEAGKELAQALRDLKPAADGVHGLLEAQQKLCAFLVGHRLKLAASVPLVLVSIGALAPNAADVLDKLLKLWGVL